jgi:hypothetical protein
VVFRASAQLDDVWMWMIDALPFASYVEVRDGPGDEASLVLLADDSWFSMEVTAHLDRDDLRAWLTEP